MEVSNTWSTETIYITDLNIKRNKEHERRQLRRKGPKYYTDGLREGEQNYLTQKKMST